VTDAAVAIMAWTQNQGLDCVLEATGHESAANLALQTVRRNGRIVVYGVYGRPVALNLDTLMYRQIHMVGACGSYGTYPKAVELLSEGRVNLRSIVNRVMPLSQLPEALHLLEQRQVFKVVIVPDRLL
jgi:threonine dehydrogenase-like Zn-dependent dehydrogenase